MRKLAIGIIGISGVLLVACGGDAKNSQPTTPTANGQAAQEGADPSAGAMQATQPSVTVTDWSSWTKVNEERILSKGHNNMWVDIYVPAEQAAAYTDPSASLAGMRIVKAQYPEENSEAPENLTVMVRDESTGSNWFWGVYAASGDRAMDSGQIDSCISCHDSAADMLFRQVE